MFVGGGGCPTPPANVAQPFPPPRASAARVRRERARPPASDLQTGEGFRRAPCFCHPARGASAAAFASPRVAAHVFLCCSRSVFSATPNQTLRPPADARAERTGIRCQHRSRPSLVSLDAIPAELQAYRDENNGSLDVPTSHPLLVRIADALAPSGVVGSGGGGGGASDDEAR